MNYVCSECGSEFHEKPTNEKIIKAAIPSHGVEVTELYEKFGHIMAITTIDIVLNVLIRKYEIYVPKEGHVASCYGEDAVRHVFPK